MVLHNGKLLRIHQNDNVAVALQDIHSGEILIADQSKITAVETIDKAHKIAIRDIAKGEHIIKYGFPIGYATAAIVSGQFVHTHNIQSNLTGLIEYTYSPQIDLGSKHRFGSGEFMGYFRNNGNVGIRNEIWIINTVGCVNRTAEILAREASVKFAGQTDGIFAFPHPFGCSQLGEDHQNTQRILAGLVDHPNTAGALVLGLGCENNNIEEFKKVLGNYDTARVKFLIAQEAEDEIETGLELISDLVEYASSFHREKCPVAKLRVGLKCGGSDAFSGITANPLVGLFSDILISQGGSSILTEVPEMFGAETILMNRCLNQDVFNKTVQLINDFKDYFMKYKLEIYENPSPGNKRGGISTLEEKSLGCTQKGGTSKVVNVLNYGERVRTVGLNLLKGPGNDIVATTALTAAGAQLILFTTGRGTPLGAPVPTIKISSNSDLYVRKPNWIDFDAGRLLADQSVEKLGEDFWNFVIQVASGEVKTQNEENGYREIAIFKEGVTL